MIFPGLGGGVCALEASASSCLRAPALWGAAGQRACLSGERAEGLLFLSGSQEIVALLTATAGVAPLPAPGSCFLSYFGHALPDCRRGNPGGSWPAPGGSQHRATSRPPRRRVVSCLHCSTVAFPGSHVKRTSSEKVKVWRRFCSPLRSQRWSC